MTGTYVPAMALTPATDALGNINGSAVLLMQALGILDGYPDGTVRPDVGINRAEFAAMIARLLHSTGQTTTGANAFTDLGAFKWAAADIGLVARRGLMKGDPDGAFRPGDLVTGGEVATVVVRLLGYEAAAQASARPWPQNAVDMAEALGIWSATYPVEYAASRGMIAACLARAVHVPLASAGTVLDAMGGLQAAEGPVLAVTVKSTGETVATFADGTIAGTDGRPDEVILTRDTIVWGAKTASELSGRQVAIIVSDNGKAVHIETLIAGTISSLTASVSGTAIWLDSGYSSVLDRNLTVLLNHRKADIGALRAGACVRLATDVTGQKITAIQAFTTETGPIMRRSEGSYAIGTSPVNLVPVNDGTVFVLNGETVDRRTLDVELAKADTATATVTWSGVSGFAARLAVLTVDTAHNGRTVAGTDLRFIHGTTLRCLTLIGDDGEYPLARTASLFRDGSLTDQPPRRGDKVSFAVDSDGEISQLWIETDNDAPALVSQAPAAAVGEYRLVFDELIDPAEVSISVDGAVYGTAGANLNTYSFETDPTTERTIIVLRPQRRLTERSHIVRFDVRDFAGNRVVDTATIDADYAPMRLASVEWPVGPTGAGASTYEVHVYFYGGEDDLIDEAWAKDLNHWTFTDANPANGLTRIKAVTHAGYYVTLVLDGPIDPGSRLHGDIRDNAGNPVIVDAVYSR